MTPLHELTAHESVRALHAGEVSSSDLVEASLARVADDRWGSFLATNAEAARARAARDRRDGRAAAAGGHPDRHQGRPVDARPHHHGRLADPGGLPPAVHRDVRGAPRARRRRRGGEDQHGRVRHGLEHGELGVPDHPQPLGRRARARRLQRGVRRRGGRVPGAVGARQRHRRLHPPAGGPVRDRGDEAHLRGGLAVRPDRLRLVAGPGGPLRAHRARQRAAAVPHRRARPDGLDLAGVARADRRCRRRPTCGACASGWSTS